MNREQLKHLAVSATVTFPTTFPRLAEIRLRQDRNLSLACGEQETTFLVAVECPSVRVTMKRVLPVSGVRAVFVPRAPNCVHLDDGTWLLGSEVEVGIRLQTANGGCLYGIVYVAEQTATLLEVEAGMSAAESAQYYPPLPCDRSVNHYDPHRHAHGPLPQETGHGFPGRQHVRQPSVGEPHHDFSSPEALHCEPGYESSAPSASYCEPDDYQQAAYQTLRPRGAFEPSPFPSEEARR